METGSTTNCRVDALCAKINCRLECQIINVTILKEKVRPFIVLDFSCSFSSRILLKACVT